MLSAHLFAQHAQYRRIFFATHPQDRPLAVQFCGNDPEILLAAARLVDGRCDYVDLNLGCPQQMAKRGYYGAFLMEDWPLLRNIVGRLASELSTPVSCKIRVFPSMKRTVAFARSLESAGCSLLAVHGRLRDQKSRGIADWHTIAAIRAAVRIPVIANGNILGQEDVALCLASTGADGVMSAETLLHNPCLYANTSGMPPSVWTVALEYLEICDELCSTVNLEELVASDDDDGKKSPLPISWVRAHLVRFFHYVLSYHADRLPADFKKRISSRTLDMAGCRQLVYDVRDAFVNDAACSMGGKEELVSPSTSRIPPFVCRARIRKGQVRMDPLSGSAEQTGFLMEEEKRAKAELRQCACCPNEDKGRKKGKRNKKRKTKLGQEERYRLKVDLTTAQRKKSKLEAPLKNQKPPRSVVGPPLHSGF
jgi:tRNA-dihydrouridine synthase